MVLALLEMREGHDLSCPSARHLLTEPYWVTLGLHPFYMDSIHSCWGEATKLLELLDSPGLTSEQATMPK